MNSDCNTAERYTHTHTASHQPSPAWADLPPAPQTGRRRGPPDIPSNHTCKYSEGCTWLVQRTHSPICRTEEVTGPPGALRPLHQALDHTPNGCAPRCQPEGQVCASSCAELAMRSVLASVSPRVIQLCRQTPEPVALIRDLKPTNVNPLQ